MNFMKVINIKAISYNRAYRTSQYNRIYLTKVGKEYKEKIKNEIGDIDKILGKVILVINFKFKDKLKRDLDNQLKLFIDAIKNIIIEDDDMIYKIIATKEQSNINQIEFQILKF